MPVHREWHKDRRFIACLLYVLSETTTKTLPSDTYPVRITPESIRPGTVFFITESHSGIVARIVADGSQPHPVQTWEATVPARLQKLSLKYFLSPRPESTVSSGLVKFRWPVLEKGTWKYLPATEHPFYSREQYTSSFYEGCVDFVDAVARRIDPGQTDPISKVDKLIETATQLLIQRVSIVQEGYKRCRKGGCPEGSELWEAYSTPGRDSMIFLLMDHLRRIIETNRLDLEKVRKRMEEISIPIARDRSVSFYHVFENSLWLSHDPGDSIEARWGLKKCERIISKIDSARKSISFIEKRYRKKDPAYADFSIRQQSLILRRLIEEFERSGCQQSNSLK